MSESASGAVRIFSLDQLLLVLLLFVPAAQLMELALGMHGTPVFISGLRPVEADRVRPRTGGQPPGRRPSLNQRAGTRAPSAPTASGVVMMM